MSKQAHVFYRGALFSYISTDEFDEVVGSDYDPKLMEEIISSYADFLCDKTAIKELNKGGGLMANSAYKKLPSKLLELDDTTLNTNEDVKLFLIAAHIFTHCYIGNSEHEVPQWWVRSNTILKAMGVQSKSPIQTRKMTMGLKDLVECKGSRFMLSWIEVENEGVKGAKKSYIAFDMDLYKNLCDNLK